MMHMAEEPRTALGSAHERFLRSLPERGLELRELVRKHQLAPADAALSEQVGRRLHTLYASAQVFQEQALVEGITATISHDGRINVAESELLRTICGVLHCPLPPMLERP